MSSSTRASSRNRTSPTATCMFGQFHTHVPHASGDKHGHGVKVIEKIVPVQGGMFVMGQLANQAITKPKGMLGSLRASRKGRAALLGATKRNSIIGFVAGRPLLPPRHRPLDLRGSAGADRGRRGRVQHPRSVEAERVVQRQDLQRRRQRRAAHGHAGRHVRDHRRPAARQEDPRHRVDRREGRVGQGRSSPTRTSTRSLDLQPGKYTINIKDSIAGDAAHFKGGFSYELIVKRTAVLASADAGAVASASASAASASGSRRRGSRQAGDQGCGSGGEAGRSGSAKPAAAAASAKPAAAPAKK